MCMQTANDGLWHATLYGLWEIQEVVHKVNLDILVLNLREKIVSKLSAG